MDEQGGREGGREEVKEWIEGRMMRVGVGRKEPGGDESHL